MSSKVPPITLNNGVEMPQLGFGVWQVPDDEARQAVATALEAGYRSIDTAAIYGNEEGTGKAIAASGVPREEPLRHHQALEQRPGIRLHTARLRHLAGQARPGLRGPVPDPLADAVQGPVRRHLQGVREDPRRRPVQAIGVSNFVPEHLERLITETSVVPAVNQIELHPHLQQQAARDFHAEQGIATEAWSPLGQGKGLLEVPAIVAIAQKHGRTPAQVVLRWHLQLGNVVIPKSVTPSRIKENIEVFDFSLDPEDLAAISALNEDRRLGPDPSTFDMA